MKKYLPLLIPTFIFFGVITFVDSAFASTISEFETPTETVMETLRGKWAKSIAIVMILAAAFVMWFKKEDLDGITKGFLVVVCIISILALAEPIIDTMFTFGSGALI
nr:TrbC/VirB2 family protein [uncultured Desulfobacter sp.]